MKLLISGGHPSPALAIIDTLLATHPDVEIAFIGRVVAQHTTGQLAGEKQAIEQRGIPFYSVHTAKWSGSIFGRITTFFSVGIAALKTYRLLGSIQPDVFLSFGSYVAVPVAIACSLRGIPVITHEQTRAAGISNRVIAQWASAVALSYPESARYFPSYKTVVTGLPLRPQLFERSVPPPAWADEAFQASRLPILYVTGGSTGSQRINAVIETALPKLLEQWRVVHPCGRATKDHDWYKQLSDVRSNLPAELQERYVVTEQVSVSDLAWLYQQPVIAVGRSGANTAAEVAAFALPAVFIPLPESNYDEQTKNAQALVATGQAELIKQSELTKETLMKAVTNLRSKLSSTKPAPVVPTAGNALIALVLQARRKP